MPAVRELLTSKFYVDEANSHSVDESSIKKLDPDEKLKLNEQGSLILISTLTSSKMILEIPNKKMLKAHMKSIEIDEIYHQSKLIKILNLIKKT